MNQNIKFFKFRIILFIILILIIFPIVSGQILVSTTVDKQNFYENEIGLLKIKILNDYDYELENVNLKIEGTKGIRLVENFEEKTVLLEKTGNIRSKGSKEIFIKLKLKSLEETQPKIFVYYGIEDNLQNASVTFINAKKSNVLIKTISKKINTANEEQLIIDFTVTNYSGNEIKGLAAEIITPKNYIIKTPPLFIETLKDNNSISQRFKTSPPPEALGNQKIFLSYAYVDKLETHYFEEVFDINIERTNYLMLAVIGVTILIIAGYLYVLRDKKDIEKVKGTAD
jgi:hypothetical protein